MTEWPTLPESVREPLHLLEPFPWQRAVVLAVLGLTAGFLLWRWYRSRRRQVLAPAPVAPTRKLGPFASAVELVRKKAHADFDFRRGCHELADLVRGALALRHGGRVERWTAAEAAVRLAGTTDTAGATLLVEISRVRFGRRPPGGEVLDTLCELAVTTFEERR